MGEVLLWYLLSVLIALINLPLTWKLFKALPSRGIYLSRPFGLLLWGYLFWMLGSLRLLANDLAGQLVVLAALLVINLLIAQKIGVKSLLNWLRTEWRMFLAVEALFIVAFGAWALVRSANPAIVGTEKPMEMAFINSILRSPGFPPNDPWLSGYGISYYYFGYVLAAMLIRITGVTAGVGYNLTAAFVFALSAIGAYGIMLDLLLLKHKDSNGSVDDRERQNWALRAALFAPVMLLLVSNWHGFLDMLHGRGLFWSLDAGGNPVSRFWEWLNLKELTNKPAVLSWFPNRQGGVQWWGASRVLQDFRLNGDAVEIIDEFPMFTYLLSDIHPHMLGMPFVFLAIAQALNALQGAWQGVTRIFRWEIPIQSLAFGVAVLSLGGIAFMNTWDFPFYLVLIAAAFVFQRYSQFGWDGKRIKEFFLLCFGLGIPAILVYFPFYLSFSSQAGGLLPSLAFFTAGKYFWIMFGSLLVPILGYLVYQAFSNRLKGMFKTAFLLTLGLFGLLFVVSWGLSFMAMRLPELGPLFLSVQGASPESRPLLDALTNRLRAPGTWITLFVLLTLALSYLLASAKRETGSDSDQKQTALPNARIFVLFLIILGALLTLAPEFVYLRDQFGNRMNTIFKFYYQAWILWSLAATYAFISLFAQARKRFSIDRIMPDILALLGLVAVYLGLSRNDAVFLKFNSNLGSFGNSALDYVLLAILAGFVVWLISGILRRKWRTVLAVLVVLGIAMASVYPVVALWNKTNGFSPMESFTLDGTQYYREYWPDQMQAVDWLAEAPLGVMVEAVSPTGGSYTTYAAVSTFSGMPTVLGWVGHVAQWRGGYLEMGNRQDDIKRLYSTPVWEEAKAILDLYAIRYVYVGELERNTYTLEEEKFAQNLSLVFDLPNARIYEVPMLEVDR